MLPIFFSFFGLSIVIIAGQVSLWCQVHLKDISKMKLYFCIPTDGA
jgi:hypothetical protein